MKPLRFWLIFASALLCAAAGGEIARAAEPPFAATLVQLDRLLPFRPMPTSPHRLRLIGAVTYALAGNFFICRRAPVR